MAGIIIALAAISMGEQLPTDLEALPGAVRVSLGTTYPISETIKILYDLRPYSQILKSLRKHNEELYIVEHQIDRDGYILNKHRDMLLGAADNIRFKLVAGIGQGLGNNTDGDTGSRVKRGLFNIVGMASHALFGLVDEDTLQGKLQEYNDQLRTVTNTYNASARAINGVIRNVRKLEEAFQLLQNNTPSSNEVESINRFTQYAFLLNQYQVALADTLHGKQELERALNQAILGNIERTLISPHDLRQVIRQIHLKQVKRPLFPLHQATLFYSTLKGYITTEGLIIIVPLKPREKYDTYEIHPFPQLLNSSNTLVTLHAKPLVLFDKNTHMIITPHIPLLESCTSPMENIFVCQMPTWNRDKNTNSCERAVISNKRDIHKVCKFDTHTHHRPSHFSYPQNGLR